MWTQIRNLRPLRQHRLRAQCLTKSPAVATNHRTQAEASSLPFLCNTGQHAAFIFAQQTVVLCDGADCRHINPQNAGRGVDFCPLAQLTFVLCDRTELRYMYAQKAGGGVDFCPLNHCAVGRPPCRTRRHTARRQVTILLHDGSLYGPDIIQHTGKGYPRLKRKGGGGVTRTEGGRSLAGRLRAVRLLSCDTSNKSEFVPDAFLFVWRNNFQILDKASPSNILGCECIHFPCVSEHARTPPSSTGLVHTCERDKCATEESIWLELRQWFHL